MNVAFYIAKRYLVAKKSHNLINIITLISVVGVGVGAFALIVVLSVFNGFEKVITEMVTSVSPDLVIEPKTGKYFREEIVDFGNLGSLQGVQSVVKVIEEDALFRYNDKQHIGRLKGVGHNYQATGIFDSLMVSGNFVLENENGEFAIAGAGVGWYLGLNTRNPAALLTVYVPKKGDPSSFSLEQAFNYRALPVSGVFNAKQEIDETHVIVPLQFAAELIGSQDELTSVELFSKDGIEMDALQKQVESIAGSNFTVKNSMQQQETLYNIMRSEKWAIFFILTFILILATFNVIGSLTMLIVDKRKDIGVLRKLGATPNLIKKLFLTEGVLITLTGGVLGLLLGIVVVLIQQYFGVLKLGNESGTFIIDAYPVHLKFPDVVKVFGVVFIIGWLSSVYTVRQIMKRFEKLMM
ncbi:MAG: FtsX-like permease family protein [Bacteroidales bacterium]|nr:FtsX-like permease family protein [Bacteroidales bacterium]